MPCKGYVASFLFQGKLYDLLVPVFGQQCAVDRVHEVVETRGHHTAFVGRLRRDDVLAQLVEELEGKGINHIYIVSDFVEQTGYFDYHALVNHF